MMVNLPKISIVIPLYKTTSDVFENVQRCLEVDYPDFEILVVADDTALGTVPAGVKLLRTGRDRTGPAQKRDLALSQAQGDIIAFLDDDAFPRRDWLRQAVTYFTETDVVGLAGPGLLPPRSPLLERASGLVLSSVFGGGVFAYRYGPRKARYVDDYPAYNLLIRRAALETVGGFRSTFYGGEDTKLCLEIAKHGRILYVPDVVVHHTARPLFRPYAAQIWNYAKHRGFFVKRFPETSRRLWFFLPTLFTVGCVSLLALSVLNATVAWTGALSFLAFFGLFALVGMVRARNPIIGVLFPLGILITHFSYGLGFVFGLTLRNLEV